MGSSVSQSRRIENPVYRYCEQDFIRYTVAVQIVLTTMLKAIGRLLEYDPGGKAWWSVGGCITITAGPTKAERILDG
jgi:hypothetical protein